MINKKGQFEKGHIPANKKTSVILKCLKCNNNFSIQPYRIKSAKFCSKSCTTSFIFKKNKHPNWRGGKPKCLDCGKELSNYINKKCSKHRGLKGDLNPKWIKDRTKLAILSNGEEYRNSPASRYWSISVKKRDNYKCRIADDKCNGKLIAHHILSWSNFPELRYEVNNGITLCHFHHPLKRNDEMRLSPYFQDLVKSV